MTLPPNLASLIQDAEIWTFGRGALGAELGDLDGRIRSRPSGSLSTPYAGQEQQIAQSRSDARAACPAAAAGEALHPHARLQRGADNRARRRRTDDGRVSVRG